MHGTYHIKHNSTVLCTVRTNTGLKACRNIRQGGFQASHREVDEKRALLGCYPAQSSNSLPTFRDNLSVQSFRVKK